MSLQIKVKDGYRFSVSPRSGENPEQACERVASVGFMAPPMKFDGTSRQYFYLPHQITSIESK